MQQARRRRPRRISVARTLDLWGADLTLLFVLGFLPVWILGVVDYRGSRLVAFEPPSWPTAAAVARTLAAAMDRHGELQARVTALVREQYPDFGPKLAREKLLERHDLVIGRETLRKWMAAAGIWLPRRERIRRAHQPRHRRACRGELVQIDGCDHEWFEDRAPRCALLVYVDDATGDLMELRFVEAESAFD